MAFGPFSVAGEDFQVRAPYFDFGGLPFGKDQPQSMLAALCTLHSALCNLQSAICRVDGRSMEHEAG